MSFHNHSFADRQKASAEAKKALIEKLKPKASITDPNFEQRKAEKAADLERVRQERALAKAAAKEAAAAAEAARRAAEEEARANDVELKKAERKERKQSQKAEARAKKERLAAYRNIKVS